MTENEAIRNIKEHLTFAGCEDLMCEVEALEMAMQALEEIQQYRAIGTVEELKTMKENGAFTGVELAQILAMQMELKKYQSIGTIEEFKALKEKNEPKKAIGKRKYDEAYCPTCNEVISDGEFWALDEYVHHCNYCGQAVKGVDWSE